MFIHSKKALEVREGGQVFAIPAGFVGDVPQWVAEHWFVRAAIADGTLSAPQSYKDTDVEKKKKPAKTTEETPVEMPTE